MTVTVTGDKSLDAFWAELPDKLHREAARAITVAQGSVLVKEQRNQLKLLVSAAARSRGGPGRGGDADTKSLAQTIDKKAWSKPAAGIIGQVVGPTYPAGSHGHLIERGHVIWARQPGGFAAPTGNRTRPMPFTRRAEVIAPKQMERAAETRFRKWIVKQRAKGAL